MTGFDEDDIAALLSPANAGLTDPDDIPPASDAATSIAPAVSPDDGLPPPAEE